MNLFSWLTVAPKATEKVLDGAISGIDKLVYTDEEKAEARTKYLETWLELQKMLGEETSVRGITRRILAIMCVGTYIFLSLFSVAMWKFDKAYADFIWEVGNAGQYGYITLTIVAFYFGPYFLEKLIGKKA